MSFAEQNSTELHNEELAKQIDSLNKDITSAISGYLDSKTKATILKKLNNLTQKDQADLKNIFQSLPQKSRTDVIQIIATACKSSNNTTHKHLCLAVLDTLKQSK